MANEKKVALITGANRGIGLETARQLGQNDITVIVAARSLKAAEETAKTLQGEGIDAFPVQLDVTKEDDRKAAAKVIAGKYGKLDILINNAGIALYDDLSDRAVLERHLAVNLFGTYGMIQAFLPPLIASGGAIVNNVSLAALAPIPVTPAYSLSKAAAFSLTQSLRMLLAGQGVRVHAVLTGPVDTDMVRDLDIPKASPQSVAQGIFDGVGKGEEDIFPDPQSAALADGWHGGPAKALERQNAALLQPQPVAS